MSEIGETKLWIRAGTEGGFLSSPEVPALLAENPFAEAAFVEKNFLIVQKILKIQGDIGVKPGKFFCKNQIISIIIYKSKKDKNI